MSGLSLSLAGFGPALLYKYDVATWLLMLVFLIVMRLSSFYFLTDQRFSMTVPRSDDSSIRWTVQASCN